MLSRLAAFVIWAAVAASIVFWAMRLWVTPIAPPAHGTVASTSSGFNGDLGRVFGVDAPPTVAALAAAPQVQADARFRLIGVVAPRAAAAHAEGLALIATEGRPPKAYRVGAAVDGELVLLGVHARGASLGPRGQPAQLALELPALPPPTTGTLPGSAFAVPTARVPAAMPPQRPQQPQALPVAPVPGPTDTDDAETQPEPTNSPSYTPPTGAGRPPTVESRPPTVDRRPPT
jgi:general secretion pathway protein C